jgi:hypothetical protein
MDALKYLNLSIRFLLELCLLAAVGYWGFSTHSSWLWKLVAGFGGPVVLAVIWGLFMAPKSSHALIGLPHMVIEFLLLALGAAALFAAHKSGLGWVYTAFLVVSTILMVIWKQ